MGSGSHTTTTTAQAPPQILPEGKPGYDAAQAYYQGILAEPPIYGGPRVAGLAPGQTNAINQAYDYFNQDQPYMTNAKDQVARTAGGQIDYKSPDLMGYNPAKYGGVKAQYDYQPYQGIASKYDYTGIGAGGGASAGGSFGGFAALPGKYDYTPETTQYGAYHANVKSPDSKFDYTKGPQWSKMDDPEMQRQIAAASEPIMAQLRENVLPDIRSSGSIAGQGGTGTRGDVARQQAVEGFGRTVGSSVIAPLIMQQSALSEDYTKAIQEMERATQEGDADRAGRASIAAESIQQQSHDLTNQINQHVREADATNKGRYASDFMNQQNVGAGVEAQYADMGTRASIANMQDATSRAVADAQNRLGYANLDVGAREQDAQNRLGYAGLDTGAQLSYDQLAQQGRLGYDTLMQGAYSDERGRQLTAAGLAPALDDAAAKRIGQLNMYGNEEQIQRQREMDAAKAAWEEPIFRQSTAANSLLGGAGVGPGGATTTQDTSNSGNWLSTIMQMATTAAAIYAMS
jgi:hypothetical protein